MAHEDVAEDALSAALKKVYNLQRPQLTEQILRRALNKIAIILNVDLIETPPTQQKE